LNYFHTLPRYRYIATSCASTDTASVLGCAPRSSSSPSFDRTFLSTLIFHEVTQTSAAPDCEKDVHTEGAGKTPPPSFSLTLPLTPRAALPEDNPGKAARARSPLSMLGFVGDRHMSFQMTRSRFDRACCLLPHFVPTIASTALLVGDAPARPIRRPIVLEQNQPSLGV